jgi:hypothetical protein
MLSASTLYWVARLVNKARNVSAILSLCTFLLMFPLITLYSAGARALVTIGNWTYSHHGSGESLGMVGMLMLYVYPLLLYAILKLTIPGIVLAIISMRPQLIFLAAITWLIHAGILPFSVVGYEDHPDWKYPILYSALVLLVAALFCNACIRQI